MTGEQAWERLVDAAGILVLVLALGVCGVSHRAHAARLERVCEAATSESAGWMQDLVAKRAGCQDGDAACVEAANGGRAAMALWSAWDAYVAACEREDMEGAEDAWREVGQRAMRATAIMAAP